MTRVNEPYKTKKPDIVEELRSVLFLSNVNEMQRIINDSVAEIEKLRSILEKRIY